MHFHKWGKWEMVGGMLVCGYIYQKKICEVCGMVKFRKDSV